MTGNVNRTKRCLALAALATALAAAGTVQVASGVAKSGTALGSLTFEAVLAMTSTVGPCPPGSPPDADLCSARTGSGAVRGLGRVSETYAFFVQEGECDGVFETTVRLEVADKGELQLEVERYRGECVSSALNLSRGFTITGGSGIYAGASGGGAVNHRASQTGSGSRGTDTWTGTLNVPGLEFDVTPPTLIGAVNKTVGPRGRRSACASATGSPPAMPSTVRSRCPASRGRAVASKSAAPSSRAQRRTPA